MSSPTQGMWTCSHGTDGRDWCEECHAPSAPQPVVLDDANEFAGYVARHGRHDIDRAWEMVSVIERGTPLPVIMRDGSAWLAQHLTGGWFVLTPPRPATPPKPATEGYGQ